MADYSIEEWEQVFKPVPNHLSDNASWQDEDGVGILFETYGAELDFVFAQDPHHVWTYIDTDSGTALCAGRHIVDRIGYFVTEKPWEGNNDDDSHICITVSTDEDFE